MTKSKLSCSIIGALLANGSHKEHPGVGGRTTEIKLDISPDFPSRVSGFNVLFFSCSTRVKRTSYFYGTS